MKAFVCLAVLLVSCWAEEACKHSNIAQKTEEQVIAEVVRDADHDRDGSITDLDVVQFFVFNFDHNKNGEVDRTEFANQWHATYKDEKAFAEHVFDHIDMKTDGVLNIDDIPLLENRADTDGSGVISVSEFQTYLEAIYAAC
ncbi:hypothetical protein LOTGIDRAFT_228325 [Lottia gigantea]|uniref:EF-hand domain-containing protein n=1 Tax=Lottia gigantea TaxID=225164 RepID=V4ASA5_LOTGI|nr:hypothetical protein LOTGIDRAFT_228325 [Lottia gigantea]ESO97755.1 hypothetical protein LOTGIDRAFT_228325 [Lottia gigantea]